MIRLSDIDWRILLGTAVTAVWLGAGLLYFLHQGGTIANIPIENLGSFLEGGFAPLAFLWLVIGMFIQQKELADNTEVMRQTMRMSERQAEVLAASELNQRQEAFFKIADNVKKQLAAVEGMLFISCFGETEGSIVSPETIHDMWHKLATGDADIFARGFLSTDLKPYGGAEKIFYGTAIRRRHTQSFVDTFDRLMRLAENCDQDGIITGTVAGTAHGMVYNMMQSASPNAASARLVDVSKYENIVQQGSG